MEILYNVVDFHTLGMIPRQRHILKSDCTNCFQLCAVFILMNTKTVCSSSHCPDDCSSIQWPVTMKYPSTFEACHASQVRLTSLWQLALKGGVFSPVQCWDGWIKHILWGNLSTSSLSLEKQNDFITCLPTVWNVDAMSYTGGDMNHIQKFQVLKSGHRLHQ